MQMSRVQQCKTKSEKKKKKWVGEEVRERMRECVEFTAWATFTPAATELVLHSNTHRYSAHSLAHTHTCPRTGWQPHDTATTHHSMPLLYPLNHSLANHMQINIPLSSGHIHHVNNEQSTTPPDFLAIPMVISKSMTVLLFYALLLSSLEVFPFGIVALLIQFFSKLPKLLHICFYPKWFIRAYISYIQHSILSSNHDALVLCPAGRKLYASF